MLPSPSLRAGTQLPDSKEDSTASDLLDMAVLLTAIGQETSQRFHSHSGLRVAGNNRVRIGSAGANVVKFEIWIVI